MSVSADPDRFRDEGGYATQLERDDLREQVGLVEALKQSLMLKAAEVSEAARQLNPELIDRWDTARRTQSLTVEQAISDFIANVEASWNDLIDHTEVRRLERIADTGSDEE